MILGGFTQQQKTAVVWYANKNLFVIMKAWPPVAHFRTAEQLLDVGVHIDRIMSEYTAYRANLRAHNKKQRAIRNAIKKGEK